MADATEAEKAIAEAVDAMSGNADAGSKAQEEGTAGMTNGTTTQATAATSASDEQQQIPIATPATAEVGASTTDATTEATAPPQNAVPAAAQSLLSALNFSTGFGKEPEAAQVKEEDGAQAQEGESVGVASMAEVGPAAASTEKQGDEAEQAAPTGTEVAEVAAPEASVVESVIGKPTDHTEVTPNGAAPTTADAGNAAIEQTAPVNGAAAEVQESEQVDTQAKTENGDGLQQTTEPTAEAPAIAANAGPTTVPEATTEPLEAMAIDQQQGTQAPDADQDTVMTEEVKTAEAPKESHLSATNGDTSMQPDTQETAPTASQTLIESPTAESSKAIEASTEDAASTAPKTAAVDAAVAPTHAAVPTSTATQVNGTATEGPSDTGRGRRNKATPQAAIVPATENGHVRRETDDMRVMWLSLPSHDHPTYYSDTDDEVASSGSSAAGALEPSSVAGRTPYIFGNRQRGRQDQWALDEDIDSSDLDDGEEAYLGRTISKQERIYRHGNRGNKLRKGVRWIRQGKLGAATEAKSEKDITERFTDRLKALQRSQVTSMIKNAQGPAMVPKEVDLLEGSGRLLVRDMHEPRLPGQTSILLAPQLLQPILSTRALLESHTLRHTFRNPHIGALSRTALDLRESESLLSRAIGRCFGAMERRVSIEALTNGHGPTVNGEGAGSSSKEVEIDAQAIGAEGTMGTEDELNPAFAQLDRLFVTKEGLPIPLGAPVDETDPMGEQQHSILSADQQREVVRAALECLHELETDSMEYVERLAEVRSRLAAVKQKRLAVWNALRIWALKREGEVFDDEGVSTMANGASPLVDGSNKTGAATAAAGGASATTGAVAAGNVGGGSSSSSRGGANAAKPTSSSGASSGKRRRVGA